MAFPDGWNYKAKLTIDSTKVGSDLTDYPVLIHTDTLMQISGIFDSDGSTPALSGGGDIRFSSDAAGSTQLPCEVVSFVTDTNPASGICELYTKLSTISSSSDTDFYIWWGKTGETQPARDSTYGLENVWTNGYYAVLHLDEAQSTTSENYKDSSPSGFHGTGVNGAPARNENGGIGRYYTKYNETTNPGIELQHYPYLSHTANFTVEVLFRRDKTTATGSTYDRIMSRGSDDLDMALNYSNGDLQAITNGDTTWRTFGSNVRIPNTDTTDWHHLVLLTSGTELSLYNDKTGASNNPISNTMTVSDSNFGIGFKQAGYQEAIDGSIDEFRLSDGHRSTDWLDATHDNMSDPSGFVSADTILSVALIYKVYERGLQVGIEEGLV
jgi:hypothetical protein